MQWGVYSKPFGAATFTTVSLPISYTSTHYNCTATSNTVFSSDGYGGVAVKNLTKNSFQVATDYKEASTIYWQSIGI